MAHTRAQSLPARK